MGPNRAHKVKPPEDVTNPEALDFFKRMSVDLDDFPHDTEAQTLVKTGARLIQRGREASALIEKLGLLVPDRFGKKNGRVNPAVTIERQSHVALVQVLRALNIQDDVVLKG